eukprot:gene1056-2269_t
MLFDTTQDPPVTNVYVVAEVLQDSWALMAAGLASLLRSIDEDKPLLSSQK